MLIDPDEFESSNITRMYGAYETALSPKIPFWKFWQKNPQPPKKVQLVESHLRQINSQATIKSFASNIVETKTAALLLDRDIIFLCTDEHWGRSIANEVAYQYMIPTINIGVSIGADGQTISGGVGIVDILYPGKPCLWCKQYLDADRIAAESLPPEDRHSLIEEHYVQNIDTKQPAVISINTTIAGLGVTQFLQLLTDFQGASGDIKRLNYNLMDATVRRGSTTITPHCTCGQIKARGDLGSLNTVSYLPNGK